MAKFHCEILTPHRRLYVGQAESAAFVTHDGEIEILDMHEACVMPVRIGLLRLRTDGLTRKAALTEGFARVKKGRLDIFVDAAEWDEEIDKDRATRALERANARLASETLRWRLDASAQAAARARNRLEIAATAVRVEAPAQSAAEQTAP
ncbi:MAG TPA: ATP synthase F1 subunit epsilon [Rectinemataceae bacterium]|nr:ATP synthase F1 subunit epsilon [Rectinemataceae bacterium]